MKKTRNIVLILLLIVSLFMIVMPKYAIRAIWYQHPGIDDYKIFSNRIIEAGECVGDGLLLRQAISQCAIKIIASRENPEPIKLRRESAETYEK